MGVHYDISWHYSWCSACALNTSYPQYHAIVLVKHCGSSIGVQWSLFHLLMLCLIHCGIFVNFSINQIFSEVCFGEFDFVIDCTFSVSPGARSHRHLYEGKTLSSARAKISWLVMLSLSIRIMFSFPRHVKYVILLFIYSRYFVIPLWRGSGYTTMFAQGTLSNHRTDIPVHRLILLA